MYVLTDGWYADKVIVGVTGDYEEALEWTNSGRQRDFDGPFNDGIPSDY